MKMAFVLCIVFVMFFASNVYAQGLNAKSVDSITLRIIQSGELVVDGYVRTANMTLYIPQYGVQDLKIISNYENTWQYANDQFGNRVVVIRWERPTGLITYRMEILVKNDARFSKPSGDIGRDALFTKEMQSIVINDKIRKIAYSYDRTWEDIVKMNEFVNNLVVYDVSMKGERKPSDWVLENKRGVCVEHTNLLAALLRASDIPVRYVVGYAYSSVDNKLIGHTWIEVLDSGGDWIPFDPTWMEGGYLDATHIKTASLLDDNQSDKLSYLGSGTITWKQSADDSADIVDIIDYTTRNITSIKLSASNVTKGGYGYVKATTTSVMCTISQIDVQSCVDITDFPVLEIYDNKRNVYVCEQSDVYWFFRERGKKDSYICPVTVFDQTESAEDVSITSIPLKSQLPTLTIDGPDTVSIGEEFSLSANVQNDFIFYSPDFGRNYGSTWKLSMRRPGRYVFYIYSNNSLASKVVSVVEKKEFDILVSAPSNAEWNDTIDVDIIAKNVGRAKTAKLRMDFNGFTKEIPLSFYEDEQKEFTVNMNAFYPGVLYASITGNSMTTYSKFVEVAPQKKSLSFLDGIIKAISDFFSGLSKISIK